MQTSIQLGFVSLQVRDLDASIRFYRYILEFQPAPQSLPDTCVFSTQSGAIFAIRKPLVDLTYESVEEIPVQPFIERLEFIANKASWGYPFRFGSFTISHSDFDSLRSALFNRLLQGLASERSDPLE